MQGGEKIIIKTSNASYDKEFLQYLYDKRIRIISNIIKRKLMEQTT